MPDAATTGAGPRHGFRGRLYIALLRLSAVICLVGTAAVPSLGKDATTEVRAIITFVLLSAATMLWIVAAGLRRFSRTAWLLGVGLLSLGLLIELAHWPLTWLELYFDAAKVFFLGWLLAYLWSRRTEFK